MKEIAKCPLCGKAPRVEPSDPGYYDLKTYHCCSHAVYADDEKLWNQYAAAMELAKATRTLENTMAPLNAGKVTIGAVLPAIRLVMEDHTACEQRVLEVFKNGHS